ncbi:hypothetical protein BGX27_006994 [Mortierella sp. AM989]|nr:hypothetical protein BGX27_006994 [Mortierella sp. AM989]
MSSESFVKRLEQQKPLGGHTGCVNTIAWDETGEFLLTGSDDLRLNIYRPLDPKPLVHSIPSGHSANIFSAKYLTNSSASKIISCCADGTTRLTDVNRYVERSSLGDWMPIHKFDCHRSMAMTYEVMPDILNGHIFYDCSEDGRINRYDTRVRTSCDCDGLEVCDKHAFININSHLREPSMAGLSSQARFILAFGRRHAETGVSAITQRPEDPNYMAAACGDDTVRIFDCRKVSSRGNHRTAQVYSFSPYVPSGWVIGKDGELEPGRNSGRISLGTKITSLKYDPCRSGQLLASYSQGNCYLIDPTGMATGISMESSKEDSHAKLDQKSADVKGKRGRSPITSSDRPADGLATSHANKKSSHSNTAATTAEKEKSSDTASSLGESGSGSMVAEAKHEPETDKPKVGTDDDKEMIDGKESEMIGPVVESDVDDEDCFAMETDSESESDSDSDSGAHEDEKEYWMRRSFHAGKTDLVQTYSGHRNVETMIKEANFFGPNSEYIMSGSDDGRIYFWDKKSGKILNVIKGDETVVNCLQPHPFSSFLLAASGIDHTIKIFLPTAEEPVNLSKIRGIKRPIDVAYELKPRVHMEETPSAGRPEDELDPELAYSDSRRNSIDDDSDDSNDSDGDDIFGTPQLIRIIRHLVQGREHRSSRTDEHQANADHDDNSDDWI